MGTIVVNGLGDLRHATPAVGVGPQMTLKEASAPLINSRPDLRPRT